MSKKNHQALGFIKDLFKDAPDLIKVLTLGDLETAELLDRLQNDDGFFEPVNLYLTGRTHVGKTTLSGKFLGREVMPITNMMDSTSTVCYGRLKSNLTYFDLPGVMSNTVFENINRVALGLKQVQEEDDPDDVLIDKLPLDDYSDARLDEQEAVGIRRQVIGIEEWNSAAGRQYAPDVVLGVVAPHTIFDRGDQRYFRALFNRHGQRVIVVFNFWQTQSEERIAADTLTENVREKITELYAKACPNAKSPVSIIEVDAKTGEGVPELVQAICNCLPPAKLGRMRRVLQNDFKILAEIQRTLHHQCTAHRIAARLAMFDVNEQRNRRDILFEASQSLVAYTAITFDVGDKLLALQEEIHDSLNKGVESVRKEQAANWEDVTETADRVRFVKEIQNRTIIDRVSRGMGERISGFFSKLLDFEGSAALDSLFELTRTESRDVAEEVERPVIETYTEVVGKRNRATGKEIRDGSDPQSRGGLSAITLILGATFGMRETCRKPELDGKKAIAYAVKEIGAKLAPHKALIERLADEPTPENEARLVELLDDCLLPPHAQKSVVSGHYSNNDNCL